MTEIFLVCFQMSIGFQVGIECKQTSSEAKYIPFQLIASFCAMFSLPPLIYHGLKMQPRELCIEAVTTWFYLPLHREFY